MEIAAERVEEMGVDVCDINMGCPANKVLKGCAGAGLMRDLGRAKEIIAACRKALKTTPLTVKFRLGVTDETVNYLELGRICEGEGVAAVALHARTAKQMYTGRADWSRIARLKEAVRIPVVGNGDVQTPEDVLAMFKETGCDAVMCGRATMKNPWIFRQAAELLAGPALSRGDARRAARRDPRPLPAHPEGRRGRAEGRPGEAPHVHGLVHARPAERGRAAPPHRVPREPAGVSRRRRGVLRDARRPRARRDAQYVFGTASFASGLT